MSDFSGNKTVIDVFLHYYAIPEFLDGPREMARKFNQAHPEYQVKIHDYEYRDLPLEIYRATQRGIQPAIAQYFYTSSQLARDMITKDGKPLMAPIEKAIAGRSEILGEQVVIDDIPVAFRNYYSFEDVLWSTPTLGSTTMFYANMNILEAAGISRIPETYEEVDAACVAIARLPGAPSHRITWPNFGWFFQDSAAQHGALLADHDNGRSGRAENLYLDSEAILAYVEWWQRLYTDGHYFYTKLLPEGDDAIKTWGENLRLFAEQEVAFAVSSSVDSTRMVEAGRAAGFRVGCGRLPHNGALPYSGSSMVGGDCLWLGANLDNATQDGALAFLQYLNNPKNAAERHRATNYLPSTGAALELLERDGWFDENPQSRLGLDLLAQGDGSMAVRGATLGDFAGIQDTLMRAMHDVLLDGAIPARRFAQAKGEAHRLLDGYNDHCLGRVQGASAGPHKFDVM